MLRKTLFAIACATAIAAGTVLPLSPAMAGSTGYTYAPYKHGWKNGYQHHNRHWTPHRSHCRWVKHPVHARIWNPWHGWVWTAAWRSKKVCY